VKVADAENRVALLLVAQCAILMRPPAAEDDEWCWTVVDANLDDLGRNGHMQNLKIFPILTSNII